MIRTKCGLTLSISRAPEQELEKARSTRTVALLGCYSVYMKPTMLVAEGSKVILGQPLFPDKKNPSVMFTFPGCGRASLIKRGHQRKLQSVLIELEQDGKGDEQVSRNSYTEPAMSNLPRDTIIEDLLAFSLWTGIRTGPFSKVPDPTRQAHSLFINAMDTNQLAAQPTVVPRDGIPHFVLGLNLLSTLPQHKTYVWGDRKVDAQLKEKAFASNLKAQEFRGAHPSGLTGTHLHYL